MKNGLFLALAFTAVCGYVMAEEVETQVPQIQDETVQPVQPDQSEEAKPAQSEEDDAFDMGDEMGLDETEEVK